MQYFDLVVIGGGLVGASLARAIAGAKLSTLIVDRLPVENSYSAELDNRGLALAYSSKQALQDLNCWHLMPNVYPIQQIHVSEQASFGFTKLCASKYKLPALGYVVSAYDLGKCLMRDLEQLADISVKRPAEIIAMSFDAAVTCWNLNIAGEYMQCKLLIVADGGNTKLDVGMHKFDYQQTAIVTNIYTAHGVSGTAYERFTPRGVLALLPFGKQRMKCVWTVANADLEKFKTYSDSDFIATVQDAIGYRSGKLTRVDVRKYYPIQQAYVDSVIANNAVLLGNAANTLHPVAAQGFNLGLRDAITLAQVLRQAQQSGAGITTDTLQHYARLRRSDQQQTRNFTNSLVRIFGDNKPHIKASRRIGLLATQVIPGLSNKIVSRGLGAWTL